MSSLGNLIGDIGKAAGAKGSYDVISAVKNPELQKRLDANLGRYDTASADSTKGLDQYIRDFLSGNKTASTRAGQEQDVINRYYNGDVERELANLRTRRADAGNQALARALGYATHSQNLDQLTRSGTGSSYDRQMALKTGGDMTLQNLLANLGQERSDLDYLRGNQLNLAGRRTGIADALALRNLVPGQAEQANFGWNTSALNSLLGLDQSNKFYGLQYDPSGWEKAGNIVGDVGQIAADVYTGGATSMLGGLGGGGARQPSTGTANWMPSGSNYFPMQSVGASAYGGGAAPWMSGFGGSPSLAAYNPMPTLGTGSMWGNILGSY